MRNGCISSTKVISPESRRARFLAVDGVVIVCFWVKFVEQRPARVLLDKLEEALGHQMLVQRHHPSLAVFDCACFRREMQRMYSVALKNVLLA
jgi:hypothetical protein